MKERAWYNISADNGESWTRQWLSIEEVKENKDMGFIVNQSDKDFYMDLLMEQQEQM